MCKIDVQEGFDFWKFRDDRWISFRETAKRLEEGNGNPPLPGGGLVL